MSKKQNAKLIMISNHIGNLLDFPQRALEVLKNCDLLIVEEDKPARQCLKLAGIHKPFLKWNEHKDPQTLETLRQHLHQGATIAYLSDQGCPTLADPGRMLLEEAFLVQAEIQVIPGPSSLTAALSACPFDLSQFSFLGFLPKSEGERIQALENFHKKNSHALILMDTPYRLKALLETCGQVVKNNRRGFLALDISGPDEDYWVGTFAQLYDRSLKLENKLNFILVLSGVYL